MNIVRTAELVATPWKNGHGLTKQLMIEPTGFGFPTDPLRGPFHWRVSCAQVDGPNDFSQFPGYDRWLLVWKGEGLILNGESLPPFSPLFFYGDEPTQCRLERGPVVDFGLIFDRSRIRASVEVMMLRETVIGHRQGTLLLFCAEHSTMINGVLLSAGDLVRFDGPMVVDVSANSRLVIMRITDVSHDRQSKI